MKIQSIMDEAYKAYGRVLDGFDAAQLISAMKETDAPADTVVYYPSIAEFEKLPIAADIKNSLFGGLEIQLGYCNGTNNKLNALEYHRNSEFGVAASDLILLLGKQQDIETDFSYDSAKVEAFFVPEGTVYEMYATTLHYAPCSVDGKPFRNVVILPAGTNTELEASDRAYPEDKLLMAKNKWLIAHAEAAIEGAVNGIKGENIAL
ncbi:uncharacterized protein DUF4867 [Kineothrix alysoides]|uniref:Uncharacterized protein DUF4867 n=1 Tax=Kineothrix alysoides TaxID=1469948 RepID=A0A4R1R4E8_9FIRM|nr:DUF4867 family protein [Kineothrix alysoides]TCL60343.1 uncharacterized protein DUF4867 [Kineothrix alysoides]